MHTTLAHDNNGKDPLAYYYLYNIIQTRCLPQQHLTGGKQGSSYHLVHIDSQQKENIIIGSVVMQKMNSRACGSLGRGSPLLMTTCNMVRITFLTTFLLFNYTCIYRQGVFQIRCTQLIGLDLQESRNFSLFLLTPSYKTQCNCYSVSAR